MVLSSNDKCICNTKLGHCNRLIYFLIECDENQFSCDGKCISVLKRCDGIKQCVDESDERNCSTGIYEYNIKYVLIIIFIAKNHINVSKCLHYVME